MSDNEDKLRLLAEKLLTSEVIFKEDLIEIFGKRQWESAEEIEMAVTANDEVSRTIETNTAEESASSEETKVEKESSTENQTEEKEDSEDVTDEKKSSTEE